MRYLSEGTPNLRDVAQSRRAQPRAEALTNLAATRGVQPIAVMATAGRRSMATTKQYVHLAGVVFRDEADALGRRLLGVQDPGTNSHETALVREEA